MDNNTLNPKESDILLYIWLGLRLYAGSGTPKILLEALKDIKILYDCTEADYLTFGVPKTEAEKLSDKDLTDAKRIYKYCVSEHIGFITYDNPYYPGRLKSIDNPPALFYYRGRVSLLDDYFCVAMVGTRSCSEKGFRIAYQTGFNIARAGGIVVNGLALGIDTACIRAALDAGGYAVGLLGCGIDRIYPSENRELFSRLARQGLILSEFPPFSRPSSYNFPVRNRVISGISVATVIFEASEGSGALLTAGHAISQGRKVFALPGNINESLYSGPLRLIKDGADVFTSANDILSDYALMFPHRLNTRFTPEVPTEMEDLAVTCAFEGKSSADKSINGDRCLPKPQKMKQSKDKDKKYGKPESKTESKAENQREKPVVNEENEIRSITTTEKKGNVTFQSEVTVDLSTLSQPERMIYSYFEKYQIMTVDEVTAKGFKTDDVLSSLTLLEVYGLIRSLPGGKYEKL